LKVQAFFGKSKIPSTSLHPEAVHGGLSLQGAFFVRTFLERALIGQSFETW
jgi:hypothetical protein